MSTTIDQKVVEMRFDNQQFEKNISASMHSLEKFNQSLKLTGATKGLEDVGAAANKVDMTGLGGAVETVRMKFSALEVMGITALTNITNTAISAGKRIVSALTIDPVKSGFSEYELKMGSIQTMMAATGESLETVNGYLNELNEYSDKTIYSFSDMTQNIGKFTNAGVSLGDSVAAIQGIANVAAVSGANSNEASRAMYNFAQALSSGYVKLIDWKSIELANMGTVEFKEQLLEAAAAAGTLTKTGDGMYKTLDGKVVSATKNFNDSLQDQWMTSEVLIGTLKKYTDTSTEIGKKATQAATEVKTLSQLYDTLKESAQSGWAQTWETIVGDFEEAKEFMTYLSKVIGGLISKSAEARNDMLENWKVLGGRTVLLESIKNLFKAIASVVKPVKEAFDEIFPPMTAERLLGFTEGLRNLTERLIVSDETAGKIKRTFKGVFAIFGIVKSVVVGVANAIGVLLEPMGDMGGGILSVTAGLGDCLVALHEFIQRTGVVTGAFKLVAKIIGGVVTILGKLLSAMGEAFSGGPARAFVAFLDGIKVKMEETGVSAEELGDALGGAFMEMGDAIKNSTVYKLLSALWNLVKNLAVGIAGTLANTFGALSESLSQGDLSGLLDILNGILTGGIGVAIWKLINTIKDRFGAVNDIAESITGLLESVTGAFKAFQNSLNAQALKTIATAILMLTAALVILSLIDKDKIADGLAAMTIMIAELVGGMALIGQIGKVQGTFALMQIATALLVAIIPLAILGSMDYDKITSGLVGMVGLLTVLISAMAVLSQIKFKASLKHASSLSTLAIALTLATVPLAILGNMEWVTIGRGLVGMISVLTVLVGAMAVLSQIKFKASLTHVSQLSAIALALTLATVPLAILGNMEWATIGRGLVGMASMLTLLISTMAILSQVKLKGALKAISQMVLITTSLIIMTVPLAILGSMSWESIIKGLVGVSAMLTLLIATMAILSAIECKGVLAKIAQMILITKALLLMAIPIVALGSIPWDTLKQGLAGMAIALGTLVVAMGIMAGVNKLSGGVTTSAGALLAISGAVLLLVPALIALSLVPLVSLGKALLVIAATFAVLGVAAAVLAPLVPVIISLSGAIALLGAGMLAAGVGSIAFGVGLGLIATSLAAFSGSAALFIKTLGLLVDGIVDITAAFVVGVITGIGKGIVALLQVLRESIPLVKDVIIELIVGLLEVIEKCAPQIVDTALNVVDALLKSLVEYAPSIIKSLFDIILIVLDGLVDFTGPLVDRLVGFLVAIIDGISRGMAPLISAIVNLFASLITGVIDAFAGVDSSNLANALMNVGILAAMALALAGVAALTPMAMIGVLGLSAIVTELIGALTAFALMSKIPGVDWVLTEGGNFLGKIGTAIGKFIGGIAGGIAAGASSSLPEIADNLSDFMTRISGFVTGAKAIDESAITGIRNLSEMILLLIGTNIVENLVSMFSGKSVVADFAKDIVVLGLGLSGFSKAVENVSTESVKAATIALTELSAMANAIPNSGGIFSWFTGDNNIAEFASQLPILGYGLLGFSNAVTGIIPGNIISAATAAEALARMADTIPNSGGIVSWFSGDNGVAAFASQLPILGYGLLGFSNAITGIVPENIEAAAEAAKSLAEMASVIPDTGGLAAWFVGENSIANFAGDLQRLGRGLLAFSIETNGITPDTVKGAAEAAKSLAEMASVIPNEGGIKAWFSGESSVSKFAGELPKLGKGLLAFSVACTGINATNVTAAANAGKALAEMTAVIPKSEGIAAWFTGETNIADFADKLPILGEGLKGFGDAVNGIVPENVTAAANAAKSLGEMTDVIPKNTKNIVSFGEHLVTFGGSLKTYFASTSSITEEAAKAMSSTIDAVKKVSEINADSAKSAAEAITALTKAIKGTAGITGESTEGFAAALKKLGSISADTFVKSFEDIKSKMTKIGKEAIEAFVKGVTDNVKTAKTSATDLVKACVDAMKEKYSSFEGAGKYLVEGFAAGISANRYMAEARARAMAAAAASAAADELDEHSPSRVGYGIGDYFGVAFVNGIADNIRDSYRTSEEMASSAKDGLSEAISKVGKFLDSDIDMTPTIRPVLDLSQVESGVRTLGGMLNIGSSVGVLTNVGAISAGMSRHGQNGNIDDVTKAIDKLGNKLEENAGNTYIIDGVTYDDGSNVALAMEEIVHAAKVERRT